MGNPDIDGYIGAAPPQAQAALKTLRAAIREAAPDARETISYKMPAFTAGHEKLVWFAAFARHVGFYPGAVTIAAFAQELAPYKTAKGSVQFPLSEPIPIDLVKRMVEFRLRHMTGGSSN